jgi:excisionase family DNA binding protein
MPDVVADPWLDSGQSAQHVGGHTSPTTIVRAAKSGRLRGVRINGGRVWRFRRSWLDEWLMNGSPDAQAERAEREVVR